MGKNNSLTVGRPNWGVNGSLRRNEDGMRDSMNMVNQGRKCFRYGKAGHV